MNPPKKKKPPNIREVSLRTWGGVQNQHRSSGWTAHIAAIEARTIIFITEEQWRKVGREFRRNRSERSRVFILIWPARRELTVLEAKQGLRFDGEGRDEWLVSVLGVFGRKRERVCFEARSESAQSEGSEEAGEGDCGNNAVLRGDYYWVERGMSSAFSRYGVGCCCR